MKCGLRQAKLLISTTIKETSRPRTLGGSLFSVHNGEMITMKPQEVKPEGRRPIGSFM